MKRIIIFFAVFALFSAQFGGYASADTYGDMYSESELSSLPGELSDETLSILGELGIDLSDYKTFLNMDANSVLDVVKNLFADRFKKPASALTLAMAILLICALISGMWNQKLGMNEAYNYLCAVSIAAVVLFPLISTVNNCITSIKAASSFMLAFIPVFAAVLIAAGSINSGLIYKSVMLGICEAVSQVSSLVISPLISLFVALGMSSALSGNEGVFKLASQIKSVANWILGFIMTVFTGFLSIQSVIGKAADNMTVKTTKFFVGSMVPVVGGALSEALTTVTAGIGMLKSTAAMWCVIVLAIILLPTIIELFLWRIVLSLLASFSQMFSVSDSAKLFEICSVAVSFIIAMLLCIFVMFILSVVIVKSGG